MSENPIANALESNAGSKTATGSNGPEQLTPKISTEEVQQVPFKDFFNAQLSKLTDCAKPTINSLTRLSHEKSVQHSDEIAAILQEKFSNVRKWF